MRHALRLAALAAGLLFFLAPAALAAEQTTTLVGANLLSKNQSDIETDLSGLAASSTSGQHSLVRDTSAGQAWQGTAAAKITSQYVGTQTMTLSLAPGWVAVQPGQAYTASAYVKASSVMRQGLVAIRWLDAAGAPLSDTRGNGDILGLTYARLVVTATPPPGAAFAYPYVEFPSVQNGNAFWVDGIQFEAGAAPSPWVAGGSAYSVAVSGSSSTGYSSAFNSGGAWYPVLRVRVRAVLRPSAPGSTTSNDAVSLQYTTCSTCSFSTLRTWRTALAVDEVVDLSGTGAVGVRLYVSNGSSTAGSVSTTAWLHEVVADGPPWTPPIQAVTTAGPVLIHSGDASVSRTSGEFVGASRILGARVQVSRLSGYGYLDGWDGSTWRTLATYSYQNAPLDTWVDLRSYTITKLRVRMSGVSPSYGPAPVIRVPEVYYTWGTPTPVNLDLSAVAVQTSTSVTATGFPRPSPACSCRWSRATCNSSCLLFRWPPARRGWRGSRGPRLPFRRHARWRRA